MIPNTTKNDSESLATAIPVGVSKLRLSQSMGRPLRNQAKSNDAEATKYESARRQYLLSEALRLSAKARANKTIEVPERITRAVERESMGENATVGRNTTRPPITNSANRPRRAFQLDDSDSTFVLRTDPSSVVLILDPRDRALHKRENARDQEEHDR